MLHYRRFILPEQVINLKAIRGYNISLHCTYPNMNINFYNSLHHFRRHI